MAPTPLSGTTDRRLGSLLTLFSNNATIAISGERIAKEIGVSRSTVWRWVQRLREVGVRVKGKPNTGYFLERVPDILTPDLLRQQLKGSIFGKKIHHFFRIDSTNRRRSPNPSPRDWWSRCEKSDESFFRRCCP